MQTKPKANSVITHTLVGNVITFNVKDAGAITLDMNRLDAAIINRATVHGLIQRISDQAALSRDIETGKPASPVDKLNAMTELVDYYHSGTNEWRMVGTLGGSRAGSLLLDALCEAYSAKTRDELRAWLKKQSVASRTALSLEPRIKLIIDRMTAELTEGVDTESLLSELE